MTIREAGKDAATKIDGTGVIVLTEIQRGIFQMSLRGVSMPSIVMATAQLMKYATELHPGFPDALEVAVANMDSLPNIGKIIEAP